MSRNINGDLYIADDALGLIWRVPAQRSDTPVAAQVWTRDPLLTRKPGGTPYGANGTEISRGQLLIGNPSQQILVAIPITARGCAGKPRVVHEGPVWASIDDFDVAPDGSVVGANISTQQVQIIHPDGSVANLAGPEVGLSQPTAVTIDDRTGDLYVTNAAFYRPPGAAPASIVRLRVIHSKHADSHADTRPGDRRLR
jgi:sugar lactone lactonase YvrE